VIRKLIKQGSGTYTISLPIKWIRRNEVLDSNYIYVKEKGSNLIISRFKRDTKTITLDINNNDSSWLRTYLASYYRLGYKNLILNFKNTYDLNQIEKILESLMGYEIINSTKKSIEIEDILFLNSHKSQDIIIKMFQTISSLYNLLNEKEKSKSNKNIESKNFKKNILKLRDYALRLIRLENTRFSYEWYTIVVFLEKISGEIYKLNSIEKNINEESIKHLKKSFSDLLILKDIFLKKDSQKIIDFHLKILDKDRKTYIQEISKNINSIVYSSSHRITHFLHAITSRLQIIYLSQDSDNK
jgi:hypothetical protein